MDTKSLCFSFAFQLKPQRETVEPVTGRLSNAAAQAGRGDELCFPGPPLRKENRARKAWFCFLG